MKWKEDITKKLKDVIIWLLVAWIWIQASWFLTAVVVDLSTITLVAAGSFPSQIISGSARVEWAMRQSLSEYLDSSLNNVEKGKNISIISRDAKASSILKESSFDIVEVQTFTWLVDALMPNENDVSWPLYFMWFSILKTDVLTSIDSTSEKWLKATVLNTIIQWWTTIVFAIEMIVLCILALMRILYLWMFIVLSPVAILMWCIEKSWEKLAWKGEKWFLGDLVKQINLKTFFVNVFKPTIVVLWIWVAVIFVSLMNKVVLDFTTKKFDLQWVTFTSSKDESSNISTEWDKTYTTVLDNELLSFTLTNAGKTLLELVLSIITVMMVYYIIQFAVTMWWWWDFVSEKIGNVQKSVTWIMESLPVLPVAGYDDKWNRTTHFISAGKILSVRTWEVESELLDRTIQKYQWKVDDVYKEQQSIITSWFNDGKIRVLKSADETAIRDVKTWKYWLDILQAQKGKIMELGNRDPSEWWLKSWEGYWMSLGPNSQNKFWIQQFTGWLNTVEENRLELRWKQMVKDWRGLATDKRSLKDLFNNTTHVKTYAEFFWLDGVDTWNELKDADISRKPE